MTLYRVVWEIDIEADTPQEAAREALRIHRKPDSIATVFDVRERDNGEFIYHIDLDCPEDSYETRI